MAASPSGRAKWCLVARREPYDATSGFHKLHWRHGGRFGHSGELALNIESGVMSQDFTGRKWNVTVETIAQRIAAKQQDHTTKVVERAGQRRADRDAAKEREVRQDMIEAAEHFLQQPERRLTTKKLRSLTGWNLARTEPVLCRLEQNETIRVAEYTVEVSNGARINVTGLELVN